MFIFSLASPPEFDSRTYKKTPRREFFYGARYGPVIRLIFIMRLNNFAIKSKY